MFLLMTIGYGLFRTKKISLQGNKELGLFLIYVILPASIVKSYMITSSQAAMKGLLISFVAALVSLTLSILISRIVFGKTYKVEHFGTAFSNAGFIGIPLVKAVVGEQGVFYIAAFVALLNILQWTYGVIVLSETKESISLKKIRTNPVILSFLFGILIFMTQLKIPSLFVDTLTIVGNMTAPIAMITLGVYIAQLPLKEFFTDRKAYLSSFYRLLIIPTLTTIFLMLIPKEYMDIKYSILIAAAAPVGSNVAIFAQLHGLDYKKAVKCICLSTLFSAITMPLIIGLAEYLWK